MKYSLMFMAKNSVINFFFALRIVFYSMIVTLENTVYIRKMAT